MEARQFLAAIGWWSCVGVTTAVALGGLDNAEGAAWCLSGHGGVVDRRIRGWCHGGGRADWTTKRERHGHTVFRGHSGFVDHGREQRLAAEWRRPGRIG